MSDENGNGQGVGVFADLGAKIELMVGSVGDLTKELKRPKRRPRRPPAQPVFGRVRASGIASSGGLVTLVPDQPGPDQGFFWYIRSIVIGGLSPTTTAAGRADVYVSSMIPNQTMTLAGLGLSDWRDQALTLPDVSFYGRGELPLRMNEHLFIVVSSATSGQQYVAGVQFEQFEEAPIHEAWDV